MSGQRLSHYFLGLNGKNILDIKNRKQRYSFLFAIVLSSTLVYEKYAKYYDLIYSSINFNSEIDEISSFLMFENPSTKAILDIGCGTGNYLIGLTKKGYHVDGIDSSPAMVEVARFKIISENIQSNIILEDMVEYSFKRSYDAAICLFGSLDYLYEDSKVKELLERIDHYLSKGGIFILDFLDIEYFKQNQPKSVILEGGQADLKSFRATLPKVDLQNERLELDFKCTIYRGREIIDYFEEIHSLRLFDHMQLLAQLKESNFSLKSSSKKGFYTRLFLQT